MTQKAPNDLEFERELLGAVLFENDVLDRCADILTADDFMAPGHRLIWATMVQMHERGLGVDLLTLRSQLVDRKVLDAVGGDDYVNALAVRVPLGRLAEQLAARIVELASRRRLITVAQQLQALAYDTTREGDVFEAADALILDATASRHRDEGPVSARDGIRAFSTELHRAATEGPRVGTTTGLRALDDLLGGGMHPGQLIVLAGPPGSGKSAVALCTALRAASAPRAGAVVVFSLEMPDAQCWTRIVANEAQVNEKGLRRPRELRFDEQSRVLRATERVGSLPLHVDGTPAVSLAQIRARCRRLKVLHGSLSLVVVDYLQLMGGSTGDGREAQVASFSRGLKALSKQLGCPVLALAQINRKFAERTDKRPQCSDLRESGAIEQDADAVVFCYRDSEFNPDADPTVIELIARKVRSGEPGTVKARWRGGLYRVDDLEQEPWQGHWAYRDDEAAVHR